MQRLLVKHLSLLSCLICVYLPTFGQESRTNWNVGVARITITPKSPMWMAGYASRNKPSQGVAQDLFAKAIAFKDENGQRLVIVTTDLIGIPRSMWKHINSEVARQFNLPVQALVLNASHTHCGPELRASKASLYGLEPERVKQAQDYVEWLQTQLVGLVGAALEDLQPSILHYSHGRAGFAMNRRLPTNRGVINSPHPDGPVDHNVPVLIAKTPDGKPRAVLFGYACHNTTMGFYEFFGDYAGCAQQYIEERHPDVTALFFMGCGGDQNPYPRSRMDLAEQHGIALANAVETSLHVVQPTVVKGPLKLAAAEVDLKFADPPGRDDLVAMSKSSNKYDQRRATVLLKQLESQGEIPDTYSYPIQVAKFGNDILMITLAGEVVVDYSLRLKKQYGDDVGAVWIAGYSHDVFGYVPSLRVLTEGGYEGGGAMRYTTLPGPFAPSVENRIVGKIAELVELVQSK